MSNPKYKTYAELSAAFKSGELDKSKYYIMLDKGGTENKFCCRYDPELSDAQNEDNDDRAMDIFITPDQEIEALFEALEIPAEWC